MKPSPLVPYEVLDEGEPIDLILFKAVRRKLLNPRIGKKHEHLRIESLDWVNVVAITQAGELVLVRQYRSGIDAMTIEIPGGVVEEDERPIAAAQRELLEETGFSSDNWQALGSVQPNPAVFNNLCHHFLALDARPVSAPTPDEGEDLEIRRIGFAEAAVVFKEGDLQHSLSLSALSRVPAIWQHFFPPQK